MLAEINILAGAASAVASDKLRDVFKGLQFVLGFSIGAPAIMFSASILRYPCGDSCNFSQAPCCHNHHISSHAVSMLMLRGSFRLRMRRAMPIDQYDVASMSHTQQAAAQMGWCGATLLAPGISPKNVGLDSCAVGHMFSCITDAPASDQGWPAWLSPSGRSLICLLVPAHGYQRNMMRAA